MNRLSLEPELPVMVYTGIETQAEAVEPSKKYQNGGSVHISGLGALANFIGQ